MIFDIENWLWKSELFDLHSLIQNRALICQRPFNVRKCLFPFNWPRVWCGSCWKILKWYLLLILIGFDLIQFFLFTVSSNWDCKAVNLASFSILSSCEAFRIGWSSVDGRRQKSKESKSGQNVQTFYKCKLGNTIRTFRIEQIIAHFLIPFKRMKQWKYLVFGGFVTTIISKLFRLFLYLGIVMVMYQSNWL